MNFFPDELHSLWNQKKQKSTVIKDFDLSKFEELENQEGKEVVKKENDESDQEEVEEEEEEEDENDYGVDYYDDEHDAFGENESQGFLFFIFR
jgi:FtsZ-interacting cell division protein ZipA